MNIFVIEILKFCIKPEVCEMGGNLWLQNGLNLLCRVCPSGQPKKDACFSPSWLLCTIFKICSQFLEILIFEKIVKIPFIQNCQNF